MRFTRSSCPITNVLDTLGDKWTLLVIRDLVLGKRRYREFTSSPERIASNILANRLKKLESEGLITRRAYQRNPIRYEYFLTEKGEGLKPVLEAILVWAAKTFSRHQEIPSLRATLRKSTTLNAPKGGRRGENEGSCSRCGRQRQDHRKGRSFADLALNLDAPVMGLNNPGADGQPKTRALLGMGPRVIRAIEPVEDPRLILWRNPDSVIGHGHSDVRLIDRHCDIDWCRQGESI